MELNETPAEQGFRNEFRSWLGDHLPEVWGRAEHPTGLDAEEEYALRRRFDEALYRDGWAGLTWPKEYGGRGGRLYEQMIFAEECARAQAPEVFNRLGLGIVGPTLIQFGTADQKTQHLRSMLASERIWCQGFSEPGAGSDLAALSTRATLAGDKFIINGQKIWTTLGQYADYCFLLARTNPDQPRHKGITALILDMKQPGVSVRPIHQINGSSDFNEVFLNDVEVPVGNVIGEVDGGWAVAMAALSFERSTNFIARQVRLVAELDALMTYARDNKGRISARQLDDLLDVSIRVTALKLTVLRHIAALEAGASPGPENNSTKVFWSETHQRLASIALEMFGSSAFQAETRQHDIPWAFIYLSSRAESIYAGTSEIQRNIIAERGLGLPR